MCAPFIITASDILCAGICARYRRHIDSFPFRQKQTLLGQEINKGHAEFFLEFFCQLVTFFHQLIREKERKEEKEKKMENKKKYNRKKKKRKE